MAGVIFKNKLINIFNDTDIKPKVASDIEKLQLKYTKLHLHYQICQILLKVGLDLNSQLAEVNRILTKKFDLLQGNIYFLNKEDNELICYASCGNERPDFPDRLGWIIPLNQPVMLAKAIKQRREIIGNIDNEIINYCLPISHQTDVMGIMDLYATIEKKLSFESLIMLKTVCAQLSSHIEEYHSFQLAQQLAITDGLTGLYNHRHFQEYLENEIRIINKKQGTIALLLLDVDYFKQINDRFGHLQGDQILLKIANIFKKAVRYKDFVARYGGEEFAVLISNTTLEEAAEVAERLRRNVEHEHFYSSEQQTPICVTISIGIAFLENPEQDQREKFINIADKALYKAKETGRNRVCNFLD